jgi:hypothetical protein
MRYMFILNEIRALDNIYFGRHCTWLKYFTYHLVYKVLMGKPEGKRPLGRQRRRWEDGIRMDLREIGFGDVDWIRLAQDRDR